MTDPSPGTGAPFSSISGWRRHPALAAPTTGEKLLLVGIAVLCGAAFLLPGLSQDQAYHHFADSRTLLGVPNALNVISNAAFLALGIYGLALMVGRRLHFFSAALSVGAFVTFAGFVLTAFGSSWYHLVPRDSGLVLDRLGMVVAFSGVLAMAASQRISDRAGYATLALASGLGLASVGAWKVFGTLTPYAILQFGGILLLLAMLALPARGPGPRWTLLVAAYVLAKVFESFDAAVFEFTRHLVSGHALKHLAAALAALAITGALRKSASGSPNSSRGSISTERT